MIKNIYTNLHTCLFHRFLFFIVLGFLASSTAFGQTATITVTPAMNEANLNGSALTLTLGGGETFVDAVLAVGNFTLIGAPTGTSVSGVTWNSATQATINLAFTPGDFDSDHSLSVQISAVELTMTLIGSLNSNALPVAAFQESATLSASPALTESNLDGAEVTITLSNESYDATLDAGNFFLGGTSGTNYPAGLSIGSVSRTNATVAVVTLAYSGADFDSDFTNFYITISNLDLVQTSSGVLTPGNRLTISATAENPTANLSGPTLTEYTLDGSIVTISLSEETFTSPGSLVAGNFWPSGTAGVNYPTGLSIGSISGTPTTTSVNLELDFNGTDFDVNFPNFRIVTDDAVLTQSGTDLTSSSLSIAYGLEPVVTGVSIPNDTMRIGSNVQVTIYVENDEGNDFTLSGGVIGGYSLNPVTPQDATTYLTSFTVTEGGLDYAASEDIHVMDLQLMNGTIPGEIYTNAYIVQDNDPIDANRPEIDYIFTQNTGPQNIGSEITMWIQADESDYSFDPASIVNTLPIASPAITITPVGGGRYRLSYIVQEGDNEVSAGGFAISIGAVDNAGNVSSPFSGLDPPNNLSIDASRPLITQASVSPTSGIMNIGDSLLITVFADQAGYRNHDNTRVNNVPVEPLHLTFTDLGTGFYQYTYIVGEEDQAVAPGFLAINIVLQDADPFVNTSVPFTELDPNTVSIATNRPSASVSGSAEICQGDSARIAILLSGTPPWILDMSDGTVVTTSQATYRPWMQPEVTTDYTVERVEDGTGNENTGTGNALITVHELPDVQILNLQSTYPLEGEAIELEYTPLEGIINIFTGPGITGGPPWFFDPGLADTVNSPHEITYSVTDANSCTSSDTRIVNVVADRGFIQPERDVACFNDETFMITGSNVAGTTGSFSVIPTPPSGAFEDLGNNTAILRPALYNLSADRTITIRYTFMDGGQPFTIPRDLTIQYLEPAQIDLILSTTMCQNVEPFELSGNYESGYTFTGPGVVSDSGRYMFYPDFVYEDSILIFYEHTSVELCRVSDSVELIIQDAPIADFTIEEPCVSVDGGTVQFVNRTDTAISYLWYLDDPSRAPEDVSNEKDPTHDYDTGTYTVVLTAYNADCNDQLSRPIQILPKTNAEFIWNSDCQSDDPVILTGTEILQGTDSVVSWTWNIKRGGTEIFRSETSGNQISYAFSDTIYTIGYGISTKAGCTDSTERTISLSPTYLLVQEPYFEGFELEQNDWVTIAGTPQNSWTFDPVNPDEFPENAASGMRAWYTSLPENRTPENSWVLSPCFNFENFNRPMISMDIKRSLADLWDGAALQYTIDQGATWHNVGDLDDGGKDWYHAKNIYTYIGDDEEEKTGWTGVVDDDWVEAAHQIDEVEDEKEVRFRIAYATIGNSLTGTYEGFAFDNFNIRQRTRFSLLEYFTNANTGLCTDADSTIMKIMNDAAPDVIDVQYHAAGSEPDEFNIETPFPALNRGTLYGVTGIPEAILDGGIYYDELGYNMTYDFNSRTPSLADIRLRSLEDPDFKLTITMEETTPSPSFSVDIEATRALGRSERTLYGIVLERRVDDPEYEGTNGITVFRQVARRLLPDAGGYPLGNQSWDKGDTESTVLTWESPTIDLVEGNISIVVFIQDEETKEILQAATNPEYVRSTFDESHPPASILIYPNPARELVNILFEEVPTEEMRLTLYDLSGQMVISDIIQPWQQQFTRSVGELEQGMYILEIRTKDRRQVLYRDKLLHY